MKRKNYWFFSINPETGQAFCNAWRAITPDELAPEYDHYKRGTAEIHPGWNTGWTIHRMKMERIPE